MPTAPPVNIVIDQRLHQFVDPHQVQPSSADSHKIHPYPPQPVSVDPNASIATIDSIDATKIGTETVCYFSSYNINIIYSMSYCV